MKKQKQQVFLDYETSDDSVIYNIDDELLEENNEVVNDISEPKYKGGITTKPAKCHYVFVKSNKTIENINYKNFRINRQCHREGDNLYPPRSIQSLKDKYYIN